MTVEIITLLLRLAIVIVTCIIAPAVKHWIEAKTDTAKMDEIRKVAETAVYAAEQIYNTAEKADPDGEIRRKYVYKAVSWAAQQAGICLNDREIDTIIQAAVQEINLLKHGGLVLGEMEETNES